MNILRNKFRGSKLMAAALALAGALSPLMTLATTTAVPAAAAASAGDADTAARHPATTRTLVNPSEPAGAGAAGGKPSPGFEANRGQTDARVRFFARGDGYTLFLTRGEAVMALRGAEGGQRPGVLRMKLEGAAADPRVEGLDELPGRTSYFKRDDPSGWRTGVPSYARVSYAGVYPGVDLVYYGNGRDIEYDFYLAPGADPRSIRLAFKGARSIAVSLEGDLVLTTVGGEVRQRRPFIYQEVDGVRRAVSGSYSLLGRMRVGFRVGAYDPARPLVIDPVMSYSTYLGGNAADEGRAVAVDSSGNVYVTGETSSTNFPLADPLRPARGGDATFPKDAFVSKFDPTGTRLIYSTYFDGDGCNDTGNAIAVDDAGNAYVTGLSIRHDRFGLCTAQRVFVAKLDPSGSSLPYYNHLGCTGAACWAVGRGIAADARGFAYVTGMTITPPSESFPTTPNAFRRSCEKGDAFLLKLDTGLPPAQSVSYSTCLGGSAPDEGYAVATDGHGNAYVTGSTGSPDFPAVGAFQVGRGTTFVNAFLAKIDTNASGAQSLRYSTYLGGNGGGFVGGDVGYAVAADVHGNAYVTGITESKDFPVTAGAFDRTCGGDGDCDHDFLTKRNRSDAFVAKINTRAAGAASLVYSTYLGGPSFEEGRGIAVDAQGVAHVTGQTYSTFPTTPNALQPKLGGGWDAFITVLSPDGSRLSYSSYLGGSRDDYGHAIALDGAGGLHVTGKTASINFPTKGPLQRACANCNGDVFNGFDAFVTKIVPGGDTPTPTPTPMPTPTPTPNPTPTPTPMPTPTPTPSAGTVQFAAPGYLVGETAGDITVTVRRAGAATDSASVEFSTSDGAASSRSDYAAARGTLRFAPGETSKSFTVFVTDDTHAEGDEHLTVRLSNPAGARLGSPATVTLTIADNDGETAAANPIDAARFYARQHYVDFLNREPDVPGLTFWANQLASCGADPLCAEVKRVNVSAAFFLSIEFQQTGYLVYRMHHAAFGSGPGLSIDDFAADTQQIGRGVVVGAEGWEPKLGQNRRAYAEEFVARPAFAAKYPQTLTAAQFVDALDSAAGGPLSRGERDDLVGRLASGALGRAQVLTAVAEDADLRAREFNRAFVLMQYFGYLRREPDAEGYNFWLAKLNDHGGDYIASEMVKAFLLSEEYRRRFGRP